MSVPGHAGPSGRDDTTARDRMLARIRAANVGREATRHPGDFQGWRPDAHADAPAADPPGRDAAPVSPTGHVVAGFEEMFTSAGGEVVRLANVADAATWLRGFAADFASMALGTGVPRDVAPPRPPAGPETAAFAISVARAAIAETGSLVMDARDGRRTQLLAPVHVVLLHERSVHATAREAFIHLATDLPSALGLHSGPSKSADIGQVMVKGVHGPGRVVAVLIGD